MDIYEALEGLPPGPRSPGVGASVLQVKGALCVVCSVQCAECSVQCVVCSVLCAVCSVLCAVYSALCCELQVHSVVYSSGNLLFSAVTIFSLKYAVYYIYDHCTMQLQGEDRMLQQAIEASMSSARGGLIVPSEHSEEEEDEEDELALALRLSQEQERQRQEQAAREEEEVLRQVMELSLKEQ